LKINRRKKKKKKKEDSIESSDEGASSESPVMKKKTPLNKKERKQNRKSFEPKGADLLGLGPNFYQFNIPPVVPNNVVPPHNTFLNPQVVGNPFLNPSPSVPFQPNFNPIPPQTPLTLVNPFLTGAPTTPVVTPLKNPFL